jgi:hypothetical protein
VSQSFSLFSVIPAGSFFSVIPAAFLFSVIPSFLSHSRSFLTHSPSSTPPVGPFFLLPLPAAQRPPEISGEPSCQPACLGCPIAPQIGYPNPLCPYPYPAAATQNPSAAALLLRRAATSASPWSGRSAVPQATTTPAIGPPRRLEPPLAGN